VTPLGGAAAATGALGVVEVVTALVSPLPLLVLGGLVAPIVLAVAVLLLMPVWSRDAARNERAVAMLDRVLAAIPGSRAVPERKDVDAPPPPPAPAPDQL
jgi:hypothetical protein